MVQSEVLDDVASGVAATRRIRPTYGYYRQPNGWITVSPITRMERIKYIERGWEHLEQYGAFDMTPYVAHHPLEALLMFGGVSELPVDQVIQMGLYFDPPLVPRCRQHITQFHRTHTRDCWRGAQPAEFPQLADVPAERLGPFPCEFCDRRLPTRQAKTQHQSVAHREDLGSINTGKSLGTSLAGALSAVLSPPAPITVDIRDENIILQRQVSELQQLVNDLQPASYPKVIKRPKPKRSRKQ